MSEVKMVPVRSSNLKAIGWIEGVQGDVAKPMIRIEFQRGQSYDYWPVTKQEYESGVSATNISEWFNAFKIGKQFVKL